MNNSIPSLKLCLSAIGALALLATTTECSAQLTISPGVISLDPGQPSTTFDLFVSNSGGDQSIGGLQLNFQIDVPAGQSATRPKVTAVDALGGTIFENDNQSQLGGKVTDFKWEVSVAADFNPPDPILPGGQSKKVATITFDTTGVSPGSWIFNLTTAGGATVYQDSSANDISTTLVNGTLTVVPEINAGALVGLVLVGFAGCWRWKRGKVGAALHSRVVPSA
jgi:hypothetical protein